MFAQGKAAQPRRTASNVFAAFGRRGQSVEQVAQAKVQQRNLPGIGMHDRQQFVGVEIGRQPAVGHIGRIGRTRIVFIAILIAEFERRVPKLAQQAGVQPKAKRLVGGGQFVRSPRQKMSAKCVSSTDAARRSSSGPRGGGEHFAPRESAGRRMFGEPRLVGQQRCTNSRPRPIAGPAPAGMPAGFGLLCQCMPTLPKRAIKPLRLRRIDHRPIEQERLGREPIEIRRLHPGIAVGSQKPAMQPIDDQHNDISRRVGAFIGRFVWQRACLLESTLQRR